MTEPVAQMLRPRILLPRVGALAVGARSAAWLSPDGEIEELSLGDAFMRAAGGAIVCHAKATGRRLGTELSGAFDLLDLFAFVHPGRFCLPTVRGLARALDLPEPRSREAGCVAMLDIARSLLEDVACARLDQQSDAAGLAAIMDRGGWPWGASVLAALGAPPPDRISSRPFEVWRRLPEWEDEPREGPPGQAPVAPNEARRRLAQMIAVEQIEHAILAADHQQMAHVPTGVGLIRQQQRRAGPKVDIVIRERDRVPRGKVIRDAQAAAGAEAHHAVAVILL